MRSSGGVAGPMLLCMLTEFRVQIGGPYLYADNYAYSFFAVRDVGEEFIALLRA